MTRNAEPELVTGAPLGWLAVVLGALLLAGCSGDGERKAAAELAPRSEVELMQAMFHHHAQALRMTSLVPARSASPDVPLLARRMGLRQEAETELMRSWLAERGEEAPELHRPHGHAHGPGPLMPGMLTEEELEELASQRGERFDRLFLESMIRHHEGALTMVQVLHATGGGLEPEIGAFARHVEADQAIEIGRMQELLRKLGAGGESS